MRFPTLAAVAVVSLSLSGVARAEDEDPNVPPLERAERLERKGRELLEKGHKVDGARLVSQAWHMRARVWAAEAGTKGRADEGSQAKDRDAELAAQLARAATERMMAEVLKNDPKAAQGERDAQARAFAELRELSRRLAEASEEIKANPWKLLDEQRAEELAQLRQEHARALHGVKSVQIEANRHEGRRKVAHLKQRSEDLERKAKKAREEGRHDDAREKMRMSAETWAEARELERALERQAHGQDALPDPRQDAKPPREGGPPGYDGFERSTGHGGRRDAERAHAVPPRPPAPPMPPGGFHGVAEVRAQVEALRDEVRKVRELVESLREHIQRKAESHK